MADDDRWLRRRLNGMRQRCNNKNNPSFSLYGGRGVRVSAEWSDAESFIAWSMANGARPDLTIDRIDPSGDYCASNCRWVTRSENSSWVSARRSPMVAAKLSGAIGEQLEMFPEPRKDHCLTVRVSSSLWSEFSLACENTGVVPSAVIREVMRRYLRSVKLELSFTAVIKGRK